MNKIENINDFIVIEYLDTGLVKKNCTLKTNSCGYSYLESDGNAIILDPDALPEQKTWESEEEYLKEIDDFPGGTEELPASYIINLLNSTELNLPGNVYSIDNKNITLLQQTEIDIERKNKIIVNNKEIYNLGVDPKNAKEIWEKVYIALGSDENLTRQALKLSTQSPLSFINTKIVYPFSNIEMGYFIEQDSEQNVMIDSDAVNTVITHDMKWRLKNIHTEEVVKRIKGRVQMIIPTEDLRKGVGMRAMGIHVFYPFY